MPRFRIFAVVLLKLLLSSFLAQAETDADDVILEHPPVTVSTDWMILAKAALPAEYLGGDLSFEQITNLLAQECEDGNAAAQGLWGFALVVQGKSADETAAGTRLLNRAGEKGYVPAMLNLGYLYEDGRFVEKNGEVAFHWFSLAADQGNAEGELQLAGCYHYGLGTKQDYALAAKWCRRSADQTNYVAMKSLGYLLMKGLGGDKDFEAARYWSTRAADEGHNRRAMFNMGAICLLESSATNSGAMAEAFHWYKQSANLGDPLACYQVANFYYNGWDTVTSNLDAYHDWLLRAANAGSTDAQFFMGQACRDGNGFPKDTEKSLAWYSKAAAKNDPRALFDLAVYYFEDHTNRSSLEMARDYLLLAAQNGNREAQFQAAFCCFRGDGAPQDCEGGKEWLQKAAENNWGKAEFILFQLYLNGASPFPGCALYVKDSVEAVKWIRRAAKHDDPQAQSTLAVMLMRGNGVDKNPEEAERLLRNAAIHGYAPGQNDLGFTLLNRSGSQSDLVEAATWCKLAKSTSTDPGVVQRATVNLSDALARLTTEEKSEVDRHVNSFRPTPLVPDPLVKGWNANPKFRLEDGEFGH
jgi:TPR repeat protein